MEVGVRVPEFEFEFESPPSPYTICVLTRKIILFLHVLVSICKIGIKNMTNYCLAECIIVWIEWDDRFKVIRSMTAS